MDSNAVIKTWDRAISALQAVQNPTHLSQQSFRFTGSSNTPRTWTDAEPLSRVAGHAAGRFVPVLESFLPRALSCVPSLAAVECLVTLRSCFFREPFLKGISST